MVSPWVMGLALEYVCARGAWRVPKLLRGRSLGSLVRGNLLTRAAVKRACRAPEPELNVLRDCRMRVLARHGAPRD